MRQDSADTIFAEVKHRVAAATVGGVDMGAAVADVDDRARPPRAHEEPRDVLGRLLRGRQADALRPAREAVEPFEGEGEVAPALVAEHGVHLVHDHRADRREAAAPALRRTSGSDGSSARRAASGASRFFCTSLPSAFSGET